MFTTIISRLRHPGVGRWEKVLAGRAEKLIPFLQNDVLTIQLQLLAIVVQGAKDDSE
jgi:hypothetical protein